MQFSQSVSQVFLGINMKCASCHDSFIDRWTLEKLLASSLRTSLKTLRQTDGQASTAMDFQVDEIDPKAQAERLKQLAGLMTHQNGRFTVPS